MRTWTMALLALAFQGCESYEDALEASFNDILADMNRSEMETAAEDKLKTAFRTPLKERVESWGGTLVEVNVSFESGSTPPTLDLNELDIESTSSAYVTNFKWRLVPEWSSSGAKITVTGKIKYAGFNHNFTATLKNLSLRGHGSWQIRSPKDDGADSATITITSAIAEGDMTLEIGAIYSDSWEESSPELGEALVTAMVLDPIREERGW